ncbi:MAG: SMP-30/gluconolactonase/LRE family protein [Sphaerobacteraceae bacterium]|nr:MAG: SMP-30/gluconolactonase/LRE family protein [Sphaerobacteraceae bacterium]
MEPELIADYACATGEGPIWHESERRLYWCDIPAGRMFRYDPETGQHEQFYDGPVVGGFTIQADGSLLLFGERGAITIWRDGQTETVIDEIPDEVNTRFNDVIADPEGRVFCGTMPTDDRPGHLYRLERNGDLSIVIDGVGVSNGLGFTPDLSHMYHTDSTKRQINKYRYDRSSGEISDKQLFLQTPEGEGVPDGMTVDLEGYVWSARWDGNALFRYTPDAELDQTFKFPAKKVSSAVFAGPDYSDIYVTTAGGTNKAEEGEGAGALFRIRPGIKGRAEFQSRIGL